MRILVAGTGNLLRGDDGFGVVLARRLAQGGTPAGVQVLDIGIGGIHLVQELLDPVDVLVVLDAVDVGRTPGTVIVLRPDVRDVAALPVSQRHDELADMHYATPERVFLLARGLGILPASTWIVGAQPEDAQRVGEGLSPAVDAALDAAAREVRRLVSEAGTPWA